MRLVETRSLDILWADRFDCGGPELFEALEAIGARIVGSLASEIEISERNRAMLRRPDSLGAWESLHRGLWHMYRFTGADNERAQALFRRAAELDPTFARAHAGLSFTHFQNAFLLRPQDRRQQTEAALEAAGLSLAADERDPTAHWAMGRALWLAGDGHETASELRASVALCPSFSMGHYALAFVSSQSGDAEAAVTASDHARSARSTRCSSACSERGRWRSSGSVLSTRRPVIAALGVVQILAWGSSHYLLAVLAGPIARDTGWPYAQVIAGVPLGLLVAGAVSIRVGRAIEAQGGRRVLAASALLLAAGLTVLAAAPSPPVYFAAWLLIGAGMGAGLYDAALSTLGRLYGAGARSAITQSTLLGRVREHGLLAALGLARRGRGLARRLPRLCSPCIWPSPSRWSCSRFPARRAGRRPPGGRTRPRRSRCRTAPRSRASSRRG